MAAIDDLMAALSSNAELRQAMTNATSSDDAAKAAAAAGYKVTSQELIEAYKSRMEEMSEDQLASVAGGKNGPDGEDNGGTRMSFIKQNPLPYVNDI